MADSTFDLIQHASVAGELAPNLWGRSDFAKYDVALAEAKNWWVDYRGGLLTRPGSQFGDVIEWTAGNNIRFFPFQYSPDTSNTYICVFTKLKVRFIQDNAWVLEASKNITAVANGAANKITVTSAAHGFLDGDLVKLGALVHASLTFLNSRTVVVANKAANTFDLADAITGALITKAGISTTTGTASRVYTIVSPYADADLLELQAEQISDDLRLTHPDYPIKNLIRTTATSWAITNEAFGAGPGRVSSLTGVVGAADNYVFLYAVAAVNDQGDEGLPTLFFLSGSSDVVAKSDTQPNKITWTNLAGAVEYRIYASNSVGNDAAGLKTDAPLGYIGTSIGSAFADDGITRDFTKQPRIAGNPFANGRIKYVNVTAQGTGYAYTSTITWSAGGSGAIGYLVTYFGGASPIFGVIVLDGGHDYTAAAVTAATGASATMAAVVSPASGNYPRHSTIFQQRQVYVGSDNQPLGVFGSRPGLFSNFDTTNIGADDDSFDFDVDSDSVAPLRHVITTPGGLVVFSQLGVWLIYGRDTKTLTPNNARADIQSKAGANYAKPIFLETTIIYATSAGQEIRMMIYDGYSNRFTTENLSLLSNHLFMPGNPILRLTYAPSPRKMAYAVQEDGTLLAISVDEPNGVFAVTPNKTQGYYREIATVEENFTSSIYVAVERYIQSTRCLFFERFAVREFATLEDSFCVDAGLSLAKTAPTGRLTSSSLTGAVTFTVTGGTPFAAGDVGKVLRCGDGAATISHFTSNTQIEGAWTRTLTKTAPEVATAAIFDTGDWYLDTPATAISGLWHLIGQTVSILSDGSVVAGTVVDQYGQLTLAVAASRVAIGLGYTCQARTLPPTVNDQPIEGRRKDGVGVSMRIIDTYGLKTGTKTTALYEIQDRAKALYATPARLRTEMVEEKLITSWKRDQQVYFVQDSPRPAGILSFIRDLDIGDDKA